MNLPSPCSEIDRNTWNKLLDVSWLKESISPTGSRWGRRIADVRISKLPQNLLGIALLTSSDPESPPLDDELTLVIYRWDRYDHLGWDMPFSVTLTFPDNSVYEVEVPQSAKILDGHSIQVPIRRESLLRERVQQKSRRIPRVIYNLSAPLEKQPTQEVRRLRKNVRRMTDLIQCTSLYLVIEDDAGRREVEESGLDGFLQAYDALRSGSYKADLLRYYLLYKYGGVYLDDKTFLRYSLDSDAFDEILVECDMFIGVARTTEIAFMGSRQGSPIMLKALETAIANINQRFYSTHRLGITGNLMFQKMLTEDIPNRWQRPRDFIIYEFYGEKVMLLPISRSDEKILHEEDVLWQRQAIPSADWPRPSNYYADLWQQRQVYSDGNPPAPLRPVISANARREIIAYSIMIGAIICVGFLIAHSPPIW